MADGPNAPLVALLGAGGEVPLVDGTTRRAVELDQAASTSAHPAGAAAYQAFLPEYSSVHRGTGIRSRRATEAYEAARRTALEFAGRDPDGRDIAIICRNTTEAINHLAYRLPLERDDVVLTTVVEHHANLLPWGRVARRRYVEAGTPGTFSVADVVAGLEAEPLPKLLAVTGASNVTGWIPPIDEIIAEAHARGVPVFVDAAQLAPHHPIPAEADYFAFSGHKLYAPFGVGVLVGPRPTFEVGDPFLAGGGAVDLVDLDEVVWTAPPDREEAGSPNVVGAVALAATLRALGDLGFEAIDRHERALGCRLRHGLAGIDGVRLLGPGAEASEHTLAVASFVVEGVDHALVAARLSAEHGIAVRHGCFCAHPYLTRLLGMSEAEVAEHRARISAGDRSRMPGAVRASAGLGSTAADVDALVAAVAEIAAGAPTPVPYEFDPASGEWFPLSTAPGWGPEEREGHGSCVPG